MKYDNDDMYEKVSTLPEKKYFYKMMQMHIQNCTNSFKYTVFTYIYVPKIVPIILILVWDVKTVH